MTPNKEYWMGRALTREQEAYLRGTLLNKRMFNEYQKAADKLKKSIQSFYGKYATKHGLTYEEAVRKLTAREAREWKATLGEYVADISAAADPKVKADLTAQLDALSANSQISRLEALLADAQAQMDVMYERCREELTSGSTVIAYIIGIPLGVLLYCTSKDSIFPNHAVNTVVGVIVNILRSIPFIILLVMSQPIAKIVVGTQIGDRAFVFYLVIAAAPFVARMIESSFREVDRGVIEAAQSMGSSNWQIITKVLLPEAKPSLIVGGAIAVTTILGYTPMTYLIAGGGLGQLAIRYGLYRFQPKHMYISSLLLIIIVQILQEGLSFLAKKTDRRIRGK